MNLGTLLLFAALLALLVALGLSLRDLATRGRDPRLHDLAVRTTWAACGFLLLALLLLAGAFLLGNLDLAYVWRNTDLRYAWYQRLSGLWVGRSGSLLLWMAFLLGFWSLEEHRHVRAVTRSSRLAVGTATTADGPRSAEGRLSETETATRLEAVGSVRRIARVLLLVVVAALVAVVLLDDPFAATAPMDLEAEPFGRGINPQLIILLNAIHPPIVFLGYATTALITAFALGHLVTGQPGWLGTARRWAHLSFLFLTLGVGLGGLWAYIALGWGGYWAWDPVEVASVVPWLVVTAFLHAAYRADAKGEFPVAAPFLGLLAFPAAIFSTFVVRAGGVWVSLHSFLGPGAADSPWERFLVALDTQWEVKVYTGLLVATALSLLVLMPLHVRRIEAREASTAASKQAEKATTKEADAGPAQRSLVTRFLGHVTVGNAFVVGVLLLTGLAMVLVTILVQNANGFPSDRVREEIFTRATAPIALTAVLVMALAISIGMLRKKQILALLGLALAVGALGALAFPDVWALAMAVPVLATAAVLAGARIVLAWRTMPRRRALRTTGIHAVHLGVALLFLGHGFVSTFEEVHPPAEFAVGETKEVGPYSVRLEALDATDTDDNGRMDRIVATFHVSRDGKALGTTTAGFQYYDFMVHYKPTVGLQKQGLADIYFAPSAVHDPQQGWLFGNLPLFEQGALEAGSVDRFAVQVSTLPFIDLVWLGAILMVLGGGFLSASSWTAFRPRREDTMQVETRPTHA